MKIYTLTFQFASNYGAILQAVSLYEYLKREKNDVKIINYWPSYAINNYKFPNFLFKDFSIKKIFLSMFIVYKNYKFQSFLKKHCRLTKECRTISEVQSLDSADVIFVGSDQVWNPELIDDYDDCYFLNGEFDSIKASYAASAGQDIFSEDALIRLTKLIREFDFISVRESCFAEILNKNNVNNALDVLDPVFLNPRDFYLNLSNKPKYKDYIFVYYWDENNITSRIAKKLSFEHNIPILTVSSMFNRDGIIGLGDVSVEEFLGLIANARFVVSSSFHCIALSIILGKQFYAISAGQRSSRLTSLLLKLNLIHRYINGYDESKFLMYDFIDYADVEYLLNNEIKKSKDYISSVLEVAEMKYV